MGGFPFFFLCLVSSYHWNIGSRRAPKNRKHGAKLYSPFLYNSEGSWLLSTTLWILCFKLKKVTNFFFFICYFTKHHYTIFNHTFRYFNSKNKLKPIKPSDCRTFKVPVSFSSYQAKANRHDEFLYCITGDGTREKL